MSYGLSNSAQLCRWPRKQFGCNCLEALIWEMRSWITSGWKGTPEYLYNEKSSILGKKNSLAAFQKQTCGISPQLTPYTKSLLKKLMKVIWLQLKLLEKMSLKLEIKGPSEKHQKASATSSLDQKSGQPESCPTSRRAELYSDFFTATKEPDLRCNSAVNNHFNHSIHYLL